MRWLLELTLICNTKRVQCNKVDVCARHAGAGSFSDSGHAQSRFPCSKLKLGKLSSHHSKLHTPCHDARQQVIQRLTSHAGRADNLFLQWLSLPESQKLVRPGCYEVTLLLLT